MTVTDTLPQAPADTQSGLDFDAVLRTYEAVSRVLPETPAWSYPLLNAEAGVEVTVKHENVQPTGAFKVRGGVALMAALSPEERRRGVVTASTGNHAQSLAWAGARESLAHAEALALREGMRMVSPGDEPAIVLGHATVYLELFRRHPGLEAVYAPVGSGSGAAGACLVRDALAPGCRIIGIQSSAAPAAHRAWTSGEPATVHSRTRVAGLAVGASFTLTQSVLGRSLNDFILVDDEAIQSAVGLMATHAHTLAEGAGASSLAGLMADPTRQGPCAIVCTGGNADDHELAGISAGSVVSTDATLNC